MILSDMQRHGRSDKLPAETRLELLEQIFREQSGE
jgi:hypothetical protein